MKRFSRKTHYTIGQSEITQARRSKLTECLDLKEKNNLWKFFIICEMMPAFLFEGHFLAALHLKIKLEELNFPIWWLKYSLLVCSAIIALLNHKFLLFILISNLSGDLLLVKNILYPFLGKD